jgi:hypothetical protein
MIRRHSSWRSSFPHHTTWLEAAEVEVVFEEEDEPKDWGGEEEGVDAVEDAALQASDSEMP